MNFCLSHVTSVNYVQVQPSQQDGALQPLSLVQDMNLIPRNQLGLSSQSAFHAEHMLPYV